MTPVIFHVDVNSAFLSWSAVHRLQSDPRATDLRDIPSAVGGDVKTRHGIITAKSIPAKKYGIRTAEPVVKALEQCPDLVLVPSDFTVYRQFSHALMDILRRHSNTVEQVSIDEAYLDVTKSVPPLIIHSPKGGFLMPEEATSHVPGSFDLRGSFLSGKQQAYPYDLANQIREEVYHTLGFTVNVGISSNRLLAKTASDFVKPGRIHTLWPEEIPDKLWPMPIGDLHGCGGKSASRLNDFGIRTIGEAAHADLSLLQSILGDKGGLYIHNSANGIASSTVSDVRDDAKSYSNETTVSNDIFYENFDTDAVPVIHELSESVARRLKRDGVYAGTIDLSVKTDDFRRFSRQTQLPESTNDAVLIERTAQALARRLLLGTGSREGLFASGRKIRLIGVGASSLDHGEFRQLDLFGFMEEKKREDAVRQEQAEQQKEADDKKRRLTRMMDEIHRKFGEDSLTKGER